ncbi:hypothetical protein D3C73_1404490 [compost metagenome]
MGLWQAAMELIKLCANECHRRALWAWARSEAGGKSFAKWCREVEGISRQVGNYRKKSAILQITRAFDRKPLQHNDIAQTEALTNTPETDDKRSTIEVWRPEESKPVCGFDESLRDFSWADMQNQRRREREARKRAA